MFSITKILSSLKYILTIRFPREYRETRLWEIAVMNSLGGSIPIFLMSSNEKVYKLRNIDLAKGRYCGNEDL